MSLLSLDSWAKIAGYHPWHFWGLVHPTLASQQSSGALVCRQYDWQNAQAIGRSSLELAIEQAETTLTNYLLYSPAVRPVAFEAKVNRRGLIVLPEGRIQQLGLVSTTSLGDVNVVYSDRDGDSLNDTFTATLSTALTVDPIDSVVVLIPEVERVDGQRNDWSIRPVKVTTTLVGLTYDVTVTGPSRLLVKPMLYEAIPPINSGIDPTQVTNFLTQVTIAQQTIDESKAVQIRRSDGTTTDRTARICDSKNGIISLVSVCDGAWWHDATCCDYPSCPQVKVIVNAYAGEPMTNGEPSNFWKQIIARLACAELACIPAGLEKANAWVGHWHQDVSRIDPTKEFAFKEAALNNKFGPRRGHIHAWNEVNNLGHAIGISM